MRWEVLVMLAVVGAINLIGRIAAHRAKVKAQQAGTLPSAPGSNPAPPRVPARATAGKKPRPVLRAKQATQGAPRSARPEPIRADPETSRVRPAFAAPSSDFRAGAVIPVAVIPAAATGGSAREPIRTVVSANAGRLGRVWNARRLRQAFVAAEVLGRPAALRAGPSTAGF